MSRKGALAAALAAAKKAGFEHVLEESLVLLCQDIKAVKDDPDGVQLISVARAIISRAMKSHEEFLDRMNRIERAARTCRSFDGVDWERFITLLDVGSADELMRLLAVDSHLRRDHG